ncbi:ACT domain-containing protein [Alkaliphilus crotonatoxidans]
MTGEKNKYYIVEESVLPEVFLKTLKVQEILSRGEAGTIQEAVEIVGMSRSAYYKYKDAIRPFHEITKGKIMTISLLVEHTSGILSGILNQIAQARGSVLTINQNIPLHGVANVTISFETKEMLQEVDVLVEQIGATRGVKEINVVARE